MIARDACYHLKCFSKFTIGYRSYVNKNANPEKRKQHKAENIAMAGVSNYIEETLQTCEGEVAPFVKLSDMRKYYCQCLERLCADLAANSTRLKDCVLQMNTNLQASAHTKEVYISHNDSLAAALQFPKDNSLESDATYLQNSLQ